MGTLKKEIIREHVFAACRAWGEGAPGDWPDPGQSAYTFARYLIDSGLTDSPYHSAARFVRWALQDYGEAVDEGAPSIIGNVERRYAFDEVADLYSFWPPGARAFALNGADVRQMKRQYANPPDGEGMTINAICEAWGVPRDVFVFIKRELGWTHDQDEFTAEEHAVLTSAEMLRDREMRSRGALQRAAMRQRQVADRTDAAKWRNLAQSILEEVRDGFAAPVQLGKFAPEGTTAERMVVLSPSDLHIGKLGIDGRPIDTYGAVIETTRQIAEMSARGGASRATLLLGNDWGHVDTPARTTTAGTPQDSIHFSQVVRQSVVTARDLVLAVAELFDSVELLVVPSNHSKAGDYWMVEVLAALFGDVDGIEASSSTAERQYRRFGRNLLGFDHGDGAKASSLGATMATEAPRDWGETVHRYWHVGHLHHLHEHDVGGATVCQAPSLSTTDRWHNKRGYVLSSAANVGYLYDAEAGQIARFLRYREKNTHCVRI